MSNLPYAYKLTEKVVVSRFNAHLDTHKLREPLQSAHHTKHSSETALIKVFNDILCAVDDRQCVLLELLDLSAAFDTIDYDKMRVGMLGTEGPRRIIMLNWMEAGARWGLQTRSSITKEYFRSVTALLFTHKVAP